MLMSLSVIIYLIFTALTSTANPTIQGDDYSAQPHSSDSFNHAQSNSPILIVSTMDGKVSALDENEGRLLWSVDAGIGPLVSSSITKIKIVEDGKLVRLIPSLSGGLFKFDGVSVEALPFSADHFLSSSFKAADGSILVGDNEVTTFGVDTITGRMLYYCTAAGCDSTEKAHSSTQIIVVKRHQKTVRSVDNRNGHEKWNYSVGELHLDVSDGATKQLIPVSLQTASNEKLEKIDKLLVRPAEKKYDGQDDDGIFDEQDELQILPKKTRVQISVPDGVISLFSIKDKVKWKHKFSSAISNAWRVDGGQLHKIDLFDPWNVPALRQKRKSTRNNLAIYLGYFDSYAYIQVSRILEKASGSAISVITGETSGHKSSEHHPVKFDFLPYLAKSNQLTVVDVGEAKEGELAVYGKLTGNGNCNDKLGVFIDQSKQKTAELGYYLMSNVPFQYGLLPQSERKGKVTEISSEELSFENFPVDVIYPNLILWWKEVIAISVVLMSVLIHLLLTKFTKTSTTIHSENVKSKNVAAALPTEVLKLTQDVPAQYISRYQQDFEPLRYLGKGGFGIVLESRNKVDDCTYAIKRILLPNKQSAREKVLREVRVLAKLNHNRIVRYYNAWIEEPPARWQEKVDEEMISDISALSASGGFSFTQATSKSNRAKPTTETESKFNPSDDANSHCRVAIFEESRPFSFVSEEENHFAPFSGVSDTSDAQQRLDLSPSSCDTTVDGDQSIPFGRYTGGDNSLSIVFENAAAQASTTSRDSAFEDDACHMDKMKTSSSGGLKVRSLPRKDGTVTDVRSATHSRYDTVSSARNRATADILENVYLYIQMELCQKESLSAWLAGDHQREDRYCLEVFEQVLSAVDYIHSCSLIHRDLKPSNIFFSADGFIKVGDFGLVTETDDMCNKDSSPFMESNPWDYLSNESHTQKVGTKLYMAPEQLNSRLYNRKVDIFALGLILIELFTRFSTEMERINILLKSKEGQVDKNFQSAYPKEAHLAKIMLSQKPEKRPSASEAMKHTAFSRATDVTT